VEQRFIHQLQEIEARREDLTIRYIKLGKGGGVAEECFRNDLLYIGYDTHLQEVREWCNQARETKKRDLVVHKLQRYWVDIHNKTQGTATNFANSVLSVAEDKGDVLWFTVHNRRVYYGLSAGNELEHHLSWQDNGFNSGSSKKMKYG